MLKILTNFLRNFMEKIEDKKHFQKIFFHEIPGSNFKELSLNFLRPGTT